VSALFAQVIVTELADGTLLVRPPGVAAPIRLRKTGVRTFRGDSGEVVAFRTSSNGEPLGFTLSGSIWDPSSWDRIGILEDGRLHLAAFGAGLLVMASRVVIWPVALLTRRLRRRGQRPLSHDGKRLWRWSGWVAALFLLAPVIAAASALLSFLPPVRAIPRAVTVVSVLWLVALVGGIGMTPYARRARSSLGAGRRIQVLAIASASAMLMVMLWYWMVLPPGG
jgi:hypothetical protein